MKKIIILILSIGIFTSCSIDNDSTTINEIIGEWKLVEARMFDFSTNATIDYSNENIVYNFQTNQILTVSGGDNVGHLNGDYEYFFGKDYLGGSSSTEEEMILLVKINSSKWTYSMTNGQMILGKS
ncbi:MAG: hypothetical protein ACPH06_07855 [Flavobacteriaceae bacterium]